MAWQRVIPFGYQMRQGKIVYNQEEAEAVKQAFSSYLRGCSLNQIARTMSEQNVRYHAKTNEWNKNMVKRILENRQYLGDETYPGIIDIRTFQAVQLKKGDKNTSTSSELPKTIRMRLKCGICGAPLVRKSKVSGKTRWYCSNKDCDHAVRVSDEALVTSVKELLNALLEEGSITPSLDQVKEDTGKNALRIANELTNAFNRSTESVENIRALIFTCAAERYSEIPDNSLQYKLGCLRSRLEREESFSENQYELLDSTVSAILIKSEKEIALKLLNGQIITKEATMTWQNNER